MEKNSHVDLQTYFVSRTFSDTLYASVVVFRLSSYLDKRVAAADGAVNGCRGVHYRSRVGFSEAYWSLSRGLTSGVLAVRGGDTGVGSWSMGVFVWGSTWSKRRDPLGVKVGVRGGGEFNGDLVSNLVAN